MQLGDKRNWLDSGDFEMMYRGPYSSDFYRQLHVLLHREFRSSKTWRELRKPNGRTSRLHKRARDAASMVFNRAMLPVERRKLNRLATASDRALGLLTPDHDARSQRPSQHPRASNL